MKEIHKAMAFRLQKANDLEALEKILNRGKIKIGINDSFRNAIKLLRDSNHRFGEDTKEASNETFWGYNIKGLTVEVSSISGHFFPLGLRKIVIKIDINC